jgi:hypothetical protein
MQCLDWIEGCGAFKLPAPPSDGRNSRLVRRGTLAHCWLCATPTRKILHDDPDATQHDEVAPSRTLGGKTRDDRQHCGESQHKIAWLQRHGTLQTVSLAAPPWTASGEPVDTRQSLGRPLHAR